MAKGAANVVGSQQTSEYLDDNTIISLTQAVVQNYHVRRRSYYDDKVEHQFML
jgi:hypothetical protein